MELQLQSPSWLPIFLVILFTSHVFCQEQNVTTRGNKALSVFQVIKFPNTACVGSSSTFNGTCYTSSECLNKGGTSAGTCANGFGVCCTFMIGCGSTTSQNCTYFQVTTPAIGSCGATICKCSADICQLRLDFNTFVITGPSTVVDAANAVNYLLNGQPVAIANGSPVTQGTQCLTDTFTVTSPQGNAPPVICGTNNGQHMYVDASPSCNLLNFNLGSSAQGVTAIAARMWSIKVSQISCFDYMRLAPSGCTQYYTGLTGTFQSYNYNNGNGAELANQRQKICFRQEANICRICYSATLATDFAVSAKIAKGFVTNSFCCDYGTLGITTKGFDCVMIPGASNKAGTTMKGNSICGKSAGLVTVSGDATKNVSVCSKQTPFTFAFNTDNWSFVDAAIKGFRLNYQLLPCT